jgi:hypothetical protein
MLSIAKNGFFGAAVAAVAKVASARARMMVRWIM